VQAQAQGGSALVTTISAGSSADALAIATDITQPRINSAMATAGLAAVAYVPSSLIVVANGVATTTAAATAPGTTPAPGPGGIVPVEPPSSGGARAAPWWPALLLPAAAAWRCLSPPR
jgi:hypothetical protein